MSLATTNTESRNRHLETFLTDYSSTISQDDKPETKKQHQKKDPKKSTGHEQASELYLILGPYGFSNLGVLGSAFVLRAFFEFCSLGCF